MSALASSSRTIPARRPRAEAEIIDVDALPDEALFTQVRPSPAQRRRTALDFSQPPVFSNRDEPIVVYDSDEEAAQRLAGNPLYIRRSRPLVRQHSYRDITRAQRHDAPPAIVAIAQPLPFEAQMGRPARRHPTPPPRPPPPPRAAPPAAPPSHHQPAMGLGGAIIAMNRQSAIEDAYRRRHHQQPLPQARRTQVYGNEPAPAARSRWGIVETLRTLFGHQGRHRHEGDRSWTSYMDDDGGWGNEGWGNTAEHNGDWAEEAHVNDMVGYGPKPSVATYQPSFTHPGTPPAGFAYSFGELEPTVAGASTSQGASSHTAIVLDDDETGAHASPTLVCARCLDPLVLSGQDASAEESRQQRVWALRCGHMLDGKCIAQLMRPAPAAPEHTPRMRQDVSLPIASGSSSSDPHSSGGEGLPLRATDRKGKGKAVDRGLAAFEQDALMPLAQPQDGSMRSRLRPRRAAGSAAPSQSSTTAQPDDSDDSDDTQTGEYVPRPTRPLPRRARGAATAAAARAVPAVAPAAAPAASRAKKPRKPRQERFHWKCPVADCAHDHVSVHVLGEDEYTMDPTKGAIALFL